MAWLTGKRGSYRVQWREKPGAPVQSSQVYHDRGEAEEALRAKRQEEVERRHRRRPTSSMPIASLLKLWKESRLADGRVRQPWTLEVEHYVAAMAADQKWTTVADITRGSFDAWKNARKGVGVNRPLSMLKAVLRYAKAVHGIAIDERILEAEPVWKPERQQPPMLTDEQVGAILARAALFGPHIDALLEEMATYGPRPVDLCRVTVCDWFSSERKVRYEDTKNKTTQYRIVHDAHGRKLDALCIDSETKRRRPDDAPLFLNPYGQGWEIDKKGSATQLSSWYRNNIGDKLLMRKLEDGTELGWLLPSQTGIYVLKDYGLSRLELMVGRRAAMAVSQHKTESAFLRYQAMNDQRQKEAIAAVPLPAPLPLVPEPTPIEAAKTGA